MNNLDQFLYSTKSKLQPINIILVIILASFLFACSNKGDGTSTVTSSQNGGGIAIPNVILAANLPTSGTLRGFITVDDVTVFEMDISANGEQASVTFNTSPGLHKFIIEFRFDSTEYSATYILARAEKMFDIQNGDNNIDFADTPYDTLLFDNNNNNISNIAELEAGNNPGDTTCVLGSSLLGSCVLG